jgi:hypothetical protein
MTCEESPLISAPDLSKLLGWHVSKVRRLAERRLIPGRVYLGARLYFKTAVLNDFFCADEDTNGQ